MTKDNFLETSGILAKLAETETEKIITAANLIAESFKAGGKILACGNGGSAADAQHFVAEFVARHNAGQPALPAIALNSDTSVVTALSNDYSFESVFAGQIEGLGREGDILVAISTSGKSPNILAAIDEARQKKMKIIALVGSSVNETVKNSDLYFSVPSDSTQRVQEVHMVILHCIWELLKTNN